MMSRTISRTTCSLITICIFTSVFSGCNSGGSSGGGGGGAGDFSGPMTGIQVVPPIPTTSTGSFTATWGPEQAYLDITIIHDVQDSTAVHMHGPAAVGQNGAVIFDILGNGTVTPLRSERGVQAQVMIEARFLEVDDDFIMDVGLDLHYVQIHSTTNPAGELRGQLLVMPQLIMPPAFSDIDVTDASLTYIEGTNLNQVRLNEASIRLFNNTNDMFDIFSFLGPDLAGFDFYGNGIDVSAPNQNDVRTLMTGIYPLNPCIINVDLNAMPMASSINMLDLTLLPTLGSVTNIPSSVRLTHRPSTILGGLTMTAMYLGGQSQADDAIPLLGSVPLVGRLFSSGSKTSQATNQSLLIFVTANLIDPSGLPRGFEPFPCGVITDGIVICPEDQGAVNNGDRLMITMGLDDAVPVADMTNSYQYAFVFDSDGAGANNYEAAPAFPEDFFQGTDKWYSIEYTPSDGWRFYAIDASGGGNPQRVLTDAKIIIMDNAITLTVPQDEFVLDNPSYRATAFRYTGKLGSDEDFELSYHPGIGETLEPISLP